MRKVLLCATFLVLLAITLVGCNTIEGVGKDIESSGEKIQEMVK